MNSARTTKGASVQTVASGCRGTNLSGKGLAAADGGYVDSNDQGREPSGYGIGDGDGRSAIDESALTRVYRNF